MNTEFILQISKYIFTSGILGLIAYVFRPTNFWNVIAFLRRWWWMITLIPFIAGSLTAYSLQQTTPIFESQSTIEVLRQQKDGGQDYGDVTFLANQVSLLQSNTLSTHVIKKLKLEADPYFKKEHKTYLHLNARRKQKDLLQRFKSGLNVSLDEDSNLIHIRYEHESPIAAANIVNELVRSLYADELFTAAKLSFKNVQERLMLNEKKNGEKNASKLDGGIDGAVLEKSFLEKIVESEKQRVKSLAANLNAQNFIKHPTPKFVRVVDKATPASIPFKPNRLSILYRAIFASLILAIIITSFIEHVDERIKTIKHIKTKIEHPLIGVTPMHNHGNISSALDDPQNSITEAISSIRTNLQFSGPDGGPRIIQVTSSVSGEGKSVTAFGLAKRYASSGHRTLLIDADLRLPTFYNPHQHDGIGLSGLLTTRVDIGNHEVETSTPNVYALLSGPRVPNPTSILNSTRFDEILAYARKNFEYVIVDSPPVLGLADAPIIGAKVDATIVVIEYNRMKTENVKATIERLENSASKIAGVVLSKHPPSNKGMYSYYTYSYGANYSYSNKNRKAASKKKFDLS